MNRCRQRSWDESSQHRAASRAAVFPALQRAGGLAASGVGTRSAFCVAAVLAACLAGVPVLTPQAAGAIAEVVDASFESAPHRIVQEKSEELLELIEASRAWVDEDPERFFAEVDSLLSPAIDFRGFARGVMSVHYRKATEEQRVRFADNFKHGLLRTYALSLTSFEDGEVVVLPPDGPPRRPNRQNVRMEIRTGGNVHAVIYTMTLGKDGDWRIGNIVIAGVNIGLTFRSQFKSAVSDAKYGGDLDSVIDAWAAVVAEEGTAEMKQKEKAGA